MCDAQAGNVNGRELVADGRGMSPATGALVILVGVWMFTQVTMGDAVGRILSYVDDEEPEGAGPRGSAFLPRGTRRQYARAIRIGVGVKRGDRHVYDVLAPACAAAGGGFSCISWHRPGAVVAGTGSPSCHRFGKGTRKGAMDLVPPGQDWSLADDLVRELKQTPGVGEIVFRGDADHDPNLGASPPHVHAAVNCT